MLAALPRGDRDLLLAHGAAALLGRLPEEAVLPPLQVRLLEVAKLAGLAEVPDAHQLAQVAAFVRAHFGDLTIAELSLAFRQWAAGELTCEERPFGVLSQPWVGAVLRAYRQRRATALRAAEATARRAAEVPPPELTPADWDRRARRLVAEHRRPDGQLPRWTLPLVDWAACWHHLYQAGALPPLDAAAADQLLAAVRLEIEQEAQAELAAGRRREAEALRARRDDPDTLHQAARAYRARTYYLTNLPKP